MISRRTLLKGVGAGTLVALSSLLVNPFDSRGPTPNILLVLVDSLNDWVSALGGHPNGSTPNIDRFARRGVLFTNAHAPGTNSNAARTSLFTGLHPLTSGIYGGATHYRSLYPQLMTLPQYFLRLRYQVVGSGRLLHRPDIYTWQFEPFVPFDNALVREQLSGLDFGPNFDWGALDVSQVQMHDYKVAQWACDTIQQSSGPFFVGVGLSSTRPPWYLPRPLFRRYSPGFVELPEESSGVIPPEAQQIIESNYRHNVVSANDRWAEAIAAYLASMLFVDEMFGKLIAALDDSEHARNTVVILTSPHGIHLGDKGFWLYDTLWEQLTRVPLIISVPVQGTSSDYMSGGQVCEQPVSLVDLYPTVLDLVEQPPLHNLDGTSLVPLINEPTTVRDQPVLMARTEDELSVRTNRWRYTRYTRGGEELYEYLGDPDELINLANNPARDDIKQALRQSLDEHPMRRTTSNDLSQESS